MATFDIDVFDKVEERYVKTKACDLTLDEGELYLLRNIVGQFSDYASLVDRVFAGQPNTLLGAQIQMVRDAVYALACDLGAAVVAMQETQITWHDDDQPYPSCDCDDCIPTGVFADSR